MSQTHITDLLWVGPIQIWAVPCKVSRPENVHLRICLSVLEDWLN